MNVRNCRRCGQIFNYTGNYICAHCMDLDQQDFETVREYLFEHPNSTTYQVSEATEVELRTINRFLREGRLETDNLQLDEGEALRCEACQKKINTGRFCQECTQRMQEDFSKASRDIGAKKEVAIDESKSSKLRMHTYDAMKEK